MVRRKSHHRIRAYGEVFQRAYLMQLNVEFLLGLRRQQTVICEVPDKRFGSPPRRFTRRVEIQHGRAHYPTARTARKEMRQVEVICMRMSLATVADIVQRAAVELRRRPHIGAKINQQVFINQRRRALAQAGPAEYARLSTVSTFAGSLRESVGCGGSRKSDLHRCRRFERLCSGPLPSV